MACGTPVIAFPCGSVSEVIEEGRTGFIVNSVEEAAAAVRRLGELRRTQVRQGFEERFTATRMACDYLKLYRKLSVKRKRAKPVLRVPGAAPAAAGGLILS